MDKFSINGLSILSTFVDMAKIQLGDLVTGIRGSTLGVTYSRNRSGPYRKGKPIPFNPMTQAQQEARANVTNMAETWRTLTNSQREAWNAQAENTVLTNVFGQSYNPSGFNLFIWINTSLLSLGAGTINEPVEFVPLVAITGLTATFDDSAQSATIQFAPDPLPAGQAMVVQATPQLSDGVYSAPNRFATVEAIPGGTVSPVVITTNWFLKYPDPLNTGAAIFVRAKLVSETAGNYGPWATVRAVVVA